MSTLKFTASIFIATEFWLRVAYKSHLASRIKPPNWIDRVPFFSEIKGGPIVESQVPSSTIDGVILNKVKREVSFSRHGRLFVVVTVSGSKWAPESQPDNGSSWHVTNIRYATEWVGTNADPDPKEWVEFEVTGEMMCSA